MHTRRASGRVASSPAGFPVLLPPLSPGKHPDLKRTLSADCPYPVLHVPTPQHSVSQLFSFERSRKDGAKPQGFEAVVPGLQGFWE